MPQYKKGETAYIASIPATAAGKAPFWPLSVKKAAFPSWEGRLHIFRRMDQSTGMSLLTFFEPTRA